MILLMLRPETHRAEVPIVVHLLALHHWVLNISGLVSWVLGSTLVPREDRVVIVIRKYVVWRLGRVPNWLRVGSKQLVRAE
jgi:hypothetical protein